MNFEMCKKCDNFIHPCVVKKQSVKLQKIGCRLRGEPIFLSMTISNIRTGNELAFEQILKEMLKTFDTTPIPSDCPYQQINYPRNDIEYEFDIYLALLKAEFSPTI